MALTNIMTAAWALLCAGCTSMAAEHAEKNIAEANRVDPFAVQSAVRSKFLLQLSRLVEEGDLFDPASIASIVDMRLHSVTETLKHTVRDCGDGTQRWSESTSVTAAEPTWYRALPSGAGHLDIPAFTINPASKTGDPVFRYEISRGIHCRDWPRMQDHTSAKLSFDDLPAFSCVTPASVNREIPNARFSPGTDGASFILVDGRTDDDAGVKLRFMFRAGVTCALSATVSQDQEDGLRYQRALAKYKACKLPVDREYCASHPPFTWSNRDAHRDMVLNAYRKCGLVHDFYVKEPRSSEAAPTEPAHQFVDRKSPCDGL